MMIAVDGHAAGLVAVAEPIKESAVAALKALPAEHIQVVMLTGDSHDRRGRRAQARDRRGVAEVLPVRRRRG